ncbi:class I SAM-dependent methyltransferase [Thorsellia anophelis]|uniref:Methyltransferase domain-containing protein n=1 Tax=Thorsellia anophelis DSM 18579 TaxID=1123402 RepID=A0A1I0DHE4_9GAMM|nr:class I SAM-dependent methyltransferase [Thorsellia anophelis]SET31863.1 Methyltransferase domain-containing protein [Thorsellia anophelis DSM 18579]
MNTNEYYEKHASIFTNATFNVDVSDLRSEFLTYILPKGHILDAGCGSGRDALAFIQNGFMVTAFDASPSIASIASENIGQKVLCHTFENMDYDIKFDGIWACASLLHVPRIKLNEIFIKLADALKDTGILYLSFKYGTSERFDNHGRYFNDLNENALEVFVSKSERLEIIKTWITSDKRADRANELWLNALICKKF